ncbi:MAG TPA: riboflavin synthase [Acidimicrobiales bacterium]|nr:riboflavin synthase [Acidimicrobiales bacterium]
MFTGIVEELGRLRSRDGARMVIEATTVIGDMKIGDSIAHNGCCLTVIDIGEGTYGVDVVDETLQRTNLGELRPGDPINLERPVRLADRLGGHLVQGHVDAVGTIVRPAPDLEVQLPPGLLRYVVEKGSITVDGCSLTVVRALPGSFTVAVIPHTAAVTTLGAKGPGDRVNLEVDIVAKYVERLLDGHPGPAPAEEQ